MLADVYEEQVGDCSVSHGGRRGQNSVKERIGSLSVGRGSQEDAIRIELGLRRSNKLREIGTEESYEI